MYMDYQQVCVCVTGLVTSMLPHTPNITHLVAIMQLSMSNTAILWHTRTCKIFRLNSLFEELVCLGKFMKSNVCGLWTQAAYSVIHVIVHSDATIRLKNIMFML